MESKTITNEPWTIQPGCVDSLEIDRHGAEKENRNRSKTNH